MKKVIMLLLLSVIAQMAYCEITNNNAASIALSSSGLGIDYAHEWQIGKTSIEPHLSILWVESLHFAGLLGVRFFPFNTEGKGIFAELDYSICEYVTEDDLNNDIMHNGTLFLGNKFDWKTTFINIGLGGRYRTWRPFKTYWHSEIMLDFSFVAGLKF